MTNAQRDDNYVTTLLGVSNVDGVTPVTLYVDPVTHRLLVDTAGTVDGSGTANELTYWVDTDTVSSLAVATYPSLTEISYVKGVTSAIQTQLNARVTTSQSTPQSIGDTGDRLTKLWTTDLQTTNAPIIDSLTASEIVATDGSKALQSLAVATYPSLTELSYVKGATSSLQTQIDNIDAPTRTYTVSSSGGDFTTIQDALNNSGGVGTPESDVMFIVYPGTYTDDTINFTANNQWVVGAHNIKPSAVLVTKATGICDFGAFTGCVVKDVKMVMTLAAGAQDSTVTGTGSCNFKFCHVECIASGTIGAGDGATCYTGTGTLKIVEGSIIYTNTADRAARGKKAVLVGAASNFTIDDVKFTVTGSGTSSSMSAIRNNLAGTVLVDKCDITVTDNGSDKTYGLATIDGSGTYEVAYNSMHITNTGSGHSAIGINADADGIALTYRTMYNHIEAVAGGGGGAVAYSFLLADSDVTIISQYDDLVALDGVSNTGGTYTYLNSPSDGVLQASVGFNGALTGNADTVTNATLTTTLTVDTGTVGLTGNGANSSVLTLGAGASSISGTNTGDEVVATGAELDTGTDDVKYASAKAIKDSKNVPSVAPSTDGKLMTSNGTDWISETPTFISNLSEDTTPTLGGELDSGAHSIGFTMQTATGDGTTTIDWKLGQHMDFTFGAANETFTFTAPTKSGVYTLTLKQDGTGSRTATFPATVKWAGGVAPTLTTTATTGYDIISFRFDGTNYYAVASLNFS